VQLIDLSSSVDASAYEADPVTHEVLSPREGAVHMCAEMSEQFGLEQLDPDELPDGEFLSLDPLSLTSHAGTHVDAPSHYGTRPGSDASPPRHIDEMPLDRRAASSALGGSGSVRSGEGATTIAALLRPRCCQRTARPMAPRMMQWIFRSYWS